MNSKKKWIALLLIMSMSLCFCACNDPNGGPPDLDNPPDNGGYERIILSDSLVQEISSAYAELRNKNIDEVGFSCFAEFNGSYILMFTGWYGTMICDETIDGVTFYYPDTCSFTVYHLGEFYSLQEAFENNLLSHDDLVVIRNIHKADHPRLYSD